MFSVSRMSDVAAVGAKAERMGSAVALDGRGGADEPTLTHFPALQEHDSPPRPQGARGGQMAFVERRFVRVGLL